MQSRRLKAVLNEPLLWVSLVYACGIGVRLLSWFNSLRGVRFGLDGDCSTAKKAKGFSTFGIALPPIGKGVVAAVFQTSSPGYCPGWGME